MNCVKNDFDKLYEELSDLYEASPGFSNNIKIDLDNIKKQISELSGEVSYDDVYAWLSNPNENNIGKIFYALNIIYDIPSTPGAQYASETDLYKAIKVLIDMVNTNTVENAVCSSGLDKLTFEFADSTHNTLHAGYGTPQADLKCTTDGNLYDVKTISTLTSDLRSSIDSFTTQAALDGSQKNVHNGKYIILADATKGSAKVQYKIVDPEATDIDFKVASTLELTSRHWLTAKLSQKYTARMLAFTLKELRQALAKDAATAKDIYKQMHTNIMKVDDTAVIDTDGATEIINKLSKANSNLTTTANKLRRIYASTLYNYDQDGKSDDAVNRLKAADKTGLETTTDQLKKTVDNITTILNKVDNIAVNNNIEEN